MYLPSSGTIIGVVVGRGAEVGAYVTPGSLVAIGVEVIVR